MRREIEYLKKIIDSEVEKNTIDLTKSLKTFFEDNYRKYINFPKKPINPVKLHFSSKNKVFKLKTKENHVVSNPLFNSLGSFITNPPFDLIFKKMQYICFIEISCLKKDSLVFGVDRKKIGSNLLVIKGEIEENNDLDGKFIVSGRKTGRFNYYLPLDAGYERIVADQKVFL